MILLIVTYFRFNYKDYTLIHIMIHTDDTLENSDHFTEIDISDNNYLKQTLHASDEVHDSCIQNFCINCLPILLCTLFIGLTLGLIISILCMYYFGIEYLIKYWEKDCKQILISYILVTLIIGILSLILIITKYLFKRIKDQKNISAMVLIPTYLFLGLWGLSSYNNYSCDTLDGSNLLYFTYWVSIAQISVSLIYLFYQLLITITNSKWANAT